jgi:pyrophosphatase PpaX
MKYDIVIFDMDGTLVDTDLMLVESMMALFRKYRPDYKISLSTIIYFSGPPIEDTLAQYFPEVDHATIIQEFKDLSLQYYHLSAMLFPYTAEVLETLHRQGIKLGILTNKHHDRTIDTLKMLNIEHYFDYIVAYDDVEKPKPDPEGMFQIIEHYNVSKDRLLFVGDTIYDYQVAVSSGVDCALIGWSPRRFPAHVRPAHWLTDYRQLVEVVINGKTSV